MDAKIFTGIISAIVTILTTFVPLLIKHFKDKELYKEKLRESDFKVNHSVSVGLAIGYYFNFIKPVFEILRLNEEVEVAIDKQKSDDSEIIRVFKPENVEIKIIIPSELSKGGIDTINEYARKFEKGKIVRRNGLRDYAIKLSIDEKNNRLTIVDVANPLNAVGQYLSSLPEFTRFITQEGNIVNKMDSQEFRNRQKSEIDHFEKTIKEYARMESYGDRKLTFHSI